MTELLFLYNNWERAISDLFINKKLIKKVTQSQFPWH